MEIFQGACEEENTDIVRLLFENGWCHETQNEVIEFFFFHQSEYFFKYQIKIKRYSKKPLSVKIEITSLSF